MTPVLPLPDGLGESGLLVALGNMPKSKTVPLPVGIRIFLVLEIFSDSKKYIYVYAGGD